MDALIAQFTFLSDQALVDENFDPSTMEELMKLFEIEAYNSWAAMEEKQQKEAEESEISLGIAEDELDSAMERCMDEFRQLDEETDLMWKSELDSLVKSGESARILGKVMEKAANLASNKYVEAATASMKSAWKGISSNKIHPSTAKTSHGFS